MVPLPTHRLASSALRALSVDAELSSQVQRSFSVTSNDSALGTVTEGMTTTAHEIHLNGGALSIPDAQSGSDLEKLTILRTEYKATTNRMLRVAVNGFMESLGVVLGIMEELDTDVLDYEGIW